MTPWEYGFTVGITLGFMITSLVFAVMRLTGLS